MKIKFFTKYTTIGPSSRYRTYNYLPYFKDFDVKVIPFFDDNYEVGKRFKIFYLFQRYLKRVINILGISKKDIVFVEYEFTPYLVFNSFFFKTLNIKYIVDYDDAIFHNYDQHQNKLVRFFLKNKIKHVIKNASYVITGSSYLTQYARKYNTKVLEIPTSIDFEKYQAVYKNDVKTTQKFIIGWIGSKTTSKNLIQLAPVFKRLNKKYKDIELHLIGFDTTYRAYFNDVGVKVKYIDWNATNEIQNIKTFSVGIMPLENTAFNKGKCAFKLIQYMACGLPTIASNFESNKNVDRNKENLFADSLLDWELQFEKIIENQEKYKRVGFNNIKVVEQYYSIQSNFEKYRDIFALFKANKK